MASFINAQGETQQLPLDVTMYKAAAEKNMSLPQYLNTYFPTNAEKYGTTFEQLCASEGIFIKPDKTHGIRPSTMAEVLDGNARLEAGVVTKDSVPASRIIFPAVFLQAIESALVPNLTMAPTAVDDMIGYEESVNGDRYEQPVIDYTNPSAGYSQRIAQLAMPASMMTITVSDVARRIPTYGIGLEVSEQALKSTSIDFVALSIARQAAIEKNTRAQAALLAVWNGDLDSGDGSLSSLSQVKTTTSYDSAATGGVITQKAWMKFLMDGALKKTVTHVVTDIDTALKIEGRTGKPVITTDNPNSPRLDTLFTVANPLWPDSVKLYINTDSNWPASSIMALDKRYSLRRVTSMTANYSAIESYVMRRSTALRVDFGWEIHRMFSEATTGMTVA